MKQAYQAQSVKDDARGRWERVLPDLAPALKEAVERRGKHVPCPVHGGRDGFRVFPDVDQTGGGVCNTCGFFADGLSLLMWVNDSDFSRTIREVAEHVGGQPVSSIRREWPSVASGIARRCHPPRTPQSHLAGIPSADSTRKPSRRVSTWRGEVCRQRHHKPCVFIPRWVTTPIGVSWGAIQLSSPRSPGRGAMR
jgi:putative DNA primase/helicase